MDTVNIDVKRKVMSLLALCGGSSHDAESFAVALTTATLEKTVDIEDMLSKYIHKNNNTLQKIIFQLEDLKNGN